MLKVIKDTKAFRVFKVLLAFKALRVFKALKVFKDHKVFRDLRATLMLLKYLLTPTLLLHCQIEVNIITVLTLQA